MSGGTLPKPDLRVDTSTGARTYVVGSQQDRPNLPGVSCPFCPGGLEAPDEYEVRWFPNRWPSMPDGRCEVVLYTPEHDATFWSIGARGARKVVDLWAVRSEELGMRADIEYVLVFENRGPEVGATIAHPHGQIYAFDFVPDVPLQLLRGTAFGDPGDRLVTAAHGWRAWVPEAAIFPYALVLVPDDAVPDLPSLPDAGRDGLAALLVDVLERLDRLFDAQTPYMLWIHQRPFDGRKWPGARLHVEIVSPWRGRGVLRYVAAGELGSGVYPTTPSTKSFAAARSSSSHVSARSVRAWTTTVPSTPHSRNSGTSSSGPKARRIGSSSDVIHGYSARDGSQKCWCASTITPAVRPRRATLPRARPAGGARKGAVLFHFGRRPASHEDRGDCRMRERELDGRRRRRDAPPRTDALETSRARGRRREQRHALLSDHIDAMPAPRIQRRKRFFGVLVSTPTPARVGALLGRTRCALTVVAVVGALAAPGTAGAAAAELRSIGSFSSPIDVAAPLHEDHLLFVVERAGRVRVVRDGAVLAEPFLDISSLVGTAGEAGLLSIAFPLRYWQTGRFVVFYVDKGGSIQIAEYRRSSSNPELADPLSARAILIIQHPTYTNHYGGSTAFGPDGYLYVGTGDGGGAGDPPGNAQNLGSLLGKLLRIDPFGGAPYAVPAGNPFVGVAGARPEIFAFGLRNPWRFSFGRATGDLTIGDVGQAQREEVNAVRAPVPGGLNFGWNVYEGSLVYGPGSAPGAVFPVLEYPHLGSVCSITGGIVVRDPALPTLFGRYLYGDWCGGEIHSVTIDLPSAKGDSDAGLNVVQLVSFGEDAGGCAYAVSLEGAVYRLAAPGAFAPVPCADAPPETTITSAPASSQATSASFGFASSEAGSSFECRLDTDAWSACSSPTGYTLATGSHIFEVRATDAGGTVDPTPARASLTVAAPGQGGGGGGGGAGGGGDGGGSGAGVGAPANMTVSISAKSTALAPGDAADISVVVGNTGLQGTAQATLTISLPGEASLLGPPAVDRGSGCAGTTTLVCNLDFFPAGLTSVVRFSIRVPGSGANTVAAEIAPAEGDADASDNTAALTLQVESRSPPAAAPTPKTTTRGVSKSGTGKSDTLTGTTRNDTLRGRGGNDTLRGLAGNDLLVGGSGKDKLFGGTANDRLEARDGERDLVDCGDGRDAATVDRRDVVRNCEQVTRRP